MYTQWSQRRSACGSGAVVRRLLRETPHPLFLADGLEGRYATSPVALRLAKRIREEATGRRGRDIELEDREKYELLRFLDQVAFDRMLETELLELQAMLRGERGPGEPSTPPAGQARVGRG